MGNHLPVDIHEVEGPCQYTTGSVAGQSRWLLPSDASIFLQKTLVSKGKFIKKKRAEHCIHPLKTWTPHARHRRRQSQLYSSSCRNS